MRHIHVPRRLLKKICDHKKIDKHIYHSLYVPAKGNQFNNKQVILELIHELKAVRARERSLKEQTETRKGRARTRLKRKADREEKKRINKEAAGTTPDS